MHILKRSKSHSYHILSLNTACAHLYSRQQRTKRTTLDGIMQLECSVVVGSGPKRIPLQWHQKICYSQTQIMVVERYGHAVVMNRGNGMEYTHVDNALVVKVL